MSIKIFNKQTQKHDLENLNIYIGPLVEIESGVCLHKGVQIYGCSKITGETEIGEGTVVESSYISDSKIGNNCLVGPFSHIRNNAELGDGCRVGNFVEIKNSKIGNGSKMAHLTYVGDAIIGNRCNIGCGVVFCNYNGEIKQTSIVGDDVFIGSNVNVVAPVKIESKAYVAAGSTINKDVYENEFSIARSRQINKQNFDNPYLRKLK